MRRKRARYAEILGFVRQSDERLAVLGEAALKWRELGRVNEAKMIYEGLIVLAPNSPVGFMGLADAQLNEGHFVEAERNLRNAIHSPDIDRPMMAVAYYQLAKALFGQGRSDQASEALRTVCDLDPNGLGAELERARHHYSKQTSVSPPSRAAALYAGSTPAGGNRV